MRRRAEKALDKIENNSWIVLLQNCPAMVQRHKKLAELLPEIQDSPVIVKRQLIFHLHFNFQIDLGVCQHYLVDDHMQYCRISGSNINCSCLIPQGFCILRDKENEPMYPEFTPCFTLIEKKRKCTNCLNWWHCTKVQLNYSKRAEFSATNGAPWATEHFLTFIAEECDGFKV